MNTWEKLSIIKELYRLARQKLESYKILKTNINIENSELLPNKKLFIKNNYYVLKKLSSV